MKAWVEVIEDWETRSVSDGYDGLRELAGSDFSGAVSASDAWLFVVNGRIVGVFEYRQTTTKSTVESAGIERFDGADVTAYVAPDPSVPLLVVMKAKGGETRGQYYTQDTPIDEVDETLESGGFTGYLELSRDVLSGDYFVVYQGGRSMELAFVGNARRRLTGDDAMKRARDEVGIYEVVSTDLDVVEIPSEPESADEPESAADTAVVAENGTPSDDTTSNASSTVDEEPSASNSSTSNSAETVAEADTDEAGTGETRTDEPPADETTVGGSRAAESEGVTRTDSAATQRDPETASGEYADSPPDVERDSPSDGGATRNADIEPDTAADTEPDPITGGRPGASRRGDREPETSGRAIPSVDPARTGTGDSGREQATDQSDGSNETDSSKSELERLRDELAVRERELREVREQLATVADERDELASEVERLRGEVNRLSAELGEDLDGPSLSVAEAFDGTNLFVRYRSKGKTTLSDLHEGGGTPEELRENLQIEHHTTFAAEGATVEGAPFEDWLRGTQSYRFVEWVVGELLVEIQGAGAVTGLRGLHDALPNVDRIEFRGSVTVETEDDEYEVDYDVVCRDRMGQPLLVVATDDSREPVREGPMATLVNETTDVATLAETVAGAFFVTSSFFEADALETAQDAVGGSLLSRDQRRSYVKLSRKNGYHLCLVEARDGSFYLSVPDL